MLGDSVAFIDGVAIRTWCCPRNEKQWPPIISLFLVATSLALCMNLDSASVPCRLAALINGGVREALPNLDYSGGEGVWCLSRIIQMRICNDHICD